MSSKNAILAFVLTLSCQVLSATEPENQPGLWESVTTTLNKKTPLELSYATCIGGALEIAAIPLLSQSHIPHKSLLGSFLVMTGALFWSLSEEIPESLNQANLTVAVVLAHLYGADTTSHLIDQYFGDE